MSGKKKILFSAYSMEVGGIETALVNLLNYLADTDKYKITLVLEKRKGILLNKLNSDIRIIEYNPSYNKILGKAINCIKRLKFIAVHKNKYDASFAYATYCNMAIVTAQIASRNSNLWVHGSYLDIFNNNKDKYVKFFKDMNVDSFKNILFVSNRSKNEFETIVGKKNTILCNNIIDYNKIQDLSKETIDEKSADLCTFLYVGRMTEVSKKFSRLLEISKILRDKNLEFRVLAIGNGVDYEKYVKYVNDNNLQNYVYFLGEKNNPYPYFKISDALVLVSENEGYPVVYNEARVLKLPIITTDVSDSLQDIDGKYGIVCGQDINSVVKVMENLIINGSNKVFKSMEVFDSQKYNEDIKNKIDNIINERN